MKVFAIVIITFLTALIFMPVSGSAGESSFSVQESFADAHFNDIEPSAGTAEQPSLDNMLGVPMADKWSLDLNVRQDEMYFEQEQEALRYREDGAGSVLFGIGFKYRF